MTTMLANHLPYRRQYLVIIATGLMLGFSLSNLGFSDYAEVRSMFTFSDLRLTLCFGGAVALTGVGLRLVARGRALPHRSLHKGTVAGGILFGLGWALSGGCPAIPFVQLGEGQLAAVVTVISVAAGIALWKPLNRALGWDSGSCG